MKTLSEKAAKIYRKYNRYDPQTDYEIKESNRQQQGQGTSTR